MSPQQKWNKKNAEKLRIATAEWRQRNPEKSKEVSNSWKKRNPAKHASINMRRKAALLKRTVTWANNKAIQAFYDEAARLSKETGIAHHVDHVLPLQGELVSGLHVQNNLQVLTAVDNMSKGNRIAGEIGSPSKRGDGYGGTRKL